MRVQVKSIVDSLSASQRVKVNIRSDEHAFVTFGEVFCDDPSLQYTAYSEVPASERPPSMVDGLSKYMQMVDDKARQADEATSASVVRREVNTSENGVDVAELDGDGGGGGEPFGYSQVGNSPARPVFRPTPKFDSSKIVHFTGLCEVAPREQYQKRVKEEESACLCFTREVLNSFGAKTLIQLPVVFHHASSRVSVPDRDEEYRALLDTGANSSFISTKKVQELVLEIYASSAAVKNGDGSKQLSPGTVQITFSIGHRFKTTTRFRVINLDLFDMIIGMDLFLRHQFMFEYDPFRVSAICPGTHFHRKTNLILGVFLIRPVPQSRAASRKGDIRES